MNYTYFTNLEHFFSQNEIKSIKKKFNSFEFKEKIVTCILSISLFIVFLKSDLIHNELIFTFYLGFSFLWLFMIKGIIVSKICIDKKNLKSQTGVVTLFIYGDKTVYTKNNKGEFQSQIIVNSKGEEIIKPAYLNSFGNIKYYYKDKEFNKNDFNFQTEKRFHNINNF